MVNPVQEQKPQPPQPKTYGVVRIKVALGSSEHQGLLQDLMNSPLCFDLDWYFLPDSPSGIFIRYSLSRDKVLKKWLDDHNWGWSPRGDFIPTADEWPRSKFCGDELGPFFHDSTIFIAKYGFEITLDIALERVVHIMSFQCGRGHAEEALVLRKLYEGRQRVASLQEWENQRARS